MWENLPASFEAPSSSLQQPLDSLEHLQNARRSHSPPYLLQSHHRVVHSGALRSTQTQSICCYFSRMCRAPVLDSPEPAKNQPDDGSSSERTRAGLDYSPYWNSLLIETMNGSFQLTLATNELLCSYLLLLDARKPCLVMNFEFQTSIILVYCITCTPVLAMIHFAHRASHDRFCWIFCHLYVDKDLRSITTCKISSEIIRR